MQAWDYIYNLIPNIGSLISGWLSGFLPAWGVYLAMWLVGTVAILAFAVVTMMIVIMIERRGLAIFQLRYGPNRVGWQGVLQPVADAVKVLSKESIVPAQADRLVHLLAPVVAFTPAVAAFAVIPFAKGAIFTDLNIGILYILAISTLGVMGVVMAGWASRNKYSLFGAMREVSQMVSYEIPVVLSIIGVVMTTGSLSMVKIVEAQTMPFILLQPLGFVVYFLAVAAQINRCPFDQVEAESELVTGFNIEYSGMKFALFYMAEYTNAIVASAIVTTLFLGGWRGPLLPPYAWFFIKVLLVFFVFVWMRASLLRVRIDQVMGFAWKFLFPLALANIFITGLELIFWPGELWMVLPFVNIILLIAFVVIWSNLFGIKQGVRRQTGGT